MQQKDPRYSEKSCWATLWALIVVAKVLSLQRDFAYKRPFSYRNVILAASNPNPLSLSLKYPPFTAKTTHTQPLKPPKL